jgi:hypothetical protein
MMRESKPAKFGRIDPFCFLAAVPMLLVAVVLSWAGLVPIGIGVGILALCLLVFDSWANRPLPRVDEDQEDYPRPPRRARR